MSFFVAGAIVATTAYTSVKRSKAEKKAKKEAEEDAIEADKRARKAEVFAETEGEGIGNLGTVSLEVDDDLDDDEYDNKVRV